MEDKVKDKVAWRRGAVQPDIAKERLVFVP
jgi:hypothetical protein